jgi:UDP-N-acetylglucosamine 2-epimerase (non-hydrolysing)
LLQPLDYLDLLYLMVNSKFVMTNSVRLQEENAMLGVPCLTLRENTERPVTVSQGTNTLVGTDPDRIVAESRRIIMGFGKKGMRP